MTNIRGRRMVGWPLVMEIYGMVYWKKKNVKELVLKQSGIVRKVMLTCKIIIKRKYILASLEN